MACDKLCGYLQDVGSLTGCLSLPEAIPSPEYEGPYHVIPKAWQEQTLATRQKLMTDDVTVEEVPYAEVSNTDGTTCIIATE